MKRSDVIDRLSQNATSLRDMGANSLYLFGSTARDKARADSDIDIFIEPVKGRPFSLIDLMQMKEYLRRTLRKEVDLTTRRSLHPTLRRSIRQTAIKIF